MPLTFNISRSGVILLPILIVILLVLSAVMISRYLGIVRDSVASLFFTFGAICSTVSFYINSREVFDKSQNQHNISLEYFAVEALVISLIGILTIYLFNLMLKKYFSGSS